MNPFSASFYAHIDEQNLEEVKKLADEVVKLVGEYREMGEDTAYVEVTHFSKDVVEMVMEALREERVFWVDIVRLTPAGYRPVMRITGI